MMEQKEESEEEREKEKAKNRHRSIISYRSRWEQKEDGQETASQRMRSPIAARIWVQIFCCHDVVAHKAAAVRSLITSLQTLLRSLRREPASRGTPRRLAASSIYGASWYDGEALVVHYYLRGSTWTGPYLALRWGHDPGSTNRLPRGLLSVVLRGGGDPSEQQGQSRKRDVLSEAMWPGGIWQGHSVDNHVQSPREGPAMHR